MTANFFKDEFLEFLDFFDNGCYSSYSKVKLSRLTQSHMCGANPHDTASKQFSPADFKDSIYIPVHDPLEK